ncbi:MAG: hypothetical protein ACRD1E_04655 [Terriglobales bacterium]
MQPLDPEAAPPGRVLALVTVIQWGFWFGLAGVLVAFGLVLSLYTHRAVNEQLWLRLWPASMQLMTAAGMGQRELTSLALWTTGENGLLYAAIGVLAGGAYVGLRRLRKKT